MNVFRRNHQQGTAPICTEQSPLSLALEAVQTADNRLSDLHREFLELQDGHRLLVDTNGNIIQPLVADCTARDEISRKLHENRIARGIALYQFHTALGHWAKVKSMPL